MALLAETYRRVDPEGIINRGFRDTEKPTVIDVKSEKHKIGFRATEKNDKEMEA